MISAVEQSGVFIGPISQRSCGSNPAGAIKFIKDKMAQTDLVGMERIAYPHEELPRSELPPGRGSMPGKTPREMAEEATETDGLISGRGLVP